MEGLLGVLQHVVELSGAALKYTSEVPRDQRPANCFERRRQRGRGRDGQGSSVGLTAVMHVALLMSLFQYLARIFILSLFVPLFICYGPPPIRPQCNEDKLLWGPRIYISNLIS